MTASTRPASTMTASTMSRPTLATSTVTAPAVVRSAPARSTAAVDQRSGPASARRPTAAQLRAQAAALRALGWTYRRIARHWQRAHRLNARLAFRLAHGWTQDEAAGQWNARWPADPKSGKTFSYWESWPARGGRAPSVDSLRRLAELYLCRPGDLLDGSDYGVFDPALASAATVARHRVGPDAMASAGPVSSSPMPGASLDPDFELDLGLGFGQEFWHAAGPAGPLASSGASRPASQ